MSDVERFGPYVVHERLGAGGMATVHRATLELEGGATLDVALKRLLPQLADDKRFVEDFVREAKLAAQLKHPNIIRILELGRNARTYFIAMELVRGQPLMTLMRRAHLQKRPIPIGVVLALAGELCAALEYAHDTTDEHGAPLRIVHRDLTPSNLLITDDGHVKIIDFGVAKALSGQFMTNSGLAKGKLGYMSVEAIGGKDLDARADLFSLGVVMWELLVGKRLFKAKNEYDVIMKIRDGTITKPSAQRADCPSELDDIVVKALARDRDARWSSAAEMRAAVDEVRRYYRNQATPLEVVAWKAKLRAESSPFHAGRVESEGDDETAMRLSTDDLHEVLEAVEQPDPMGEGSRREAPVPPKFVDADTIVSIVSYATPGEAENPFASAHTPDTLSEVDPLDPRRRT